ncbi:MAG TPA: F0F1 ATP synthase subunit delta [Candidatus Saccharimonadales bacterium]
MKLNLQPSISSPQDLKSIILEIRQYAHWFSQYTVKMRASDSQPEGPAPVSQVAATLIKESSGKEQPSQKHLDDLIAGLEALETSAPRITITLAAPAPGSLKKVLVQWCREHVAPGVLVDFRFNSTLLGGMVVQYGSHVYDWSFRRQILNARGSFPEALRRV